MGNTNRGKILDFINIFLVVSYNYLRMLGMNNKIVLLIYILILAVFALLKIINIQFEKKELKKILILMGLIVFSSAVVGEVDLLIISMMAIAFLRNNSKDIIKNFLVSSVVWYVSILLLYLLGIIENNSAIRYGKDIVRNSLGFGHVNQVFLYLLPIQLCFYLLYSDKKKMINIITFGVATILYIFSNCRTGYFCTIIFIIIYNIPILINNKIIDKVVRWVFIIFTILTILVTVLYGSNGANKINQILSLRPYYLNKYINSGKLINIIGGNFDKEIPLDNVYVYLLVEKGIIIYLAYLFIITYSFKIFQKSKKYKLVTLIFLIYGLFEGYIVLPAINFIMIIQIKNIISNEKEENFIEEEESYERKNLNNSSDI